MSDDRKCTCGHLLTEHLQYRKCLHCDCLTAKPRHEYDEDACCMHCGFDGAEWWHLEKRKPKADRAAPPPCTRRA